MQPKPRSTVLVITLVILSLLIPAAVFFPDAPVSAQGGMGIRPLTNLDETEDLNESIAKAAEAKVGRVGGQCKMFVRLVVNSVGIPLSGGYRQTYLDNGIEIDIDQADRGDIIQTYNAAKPEYGSDYSLHTAIIVKRLEDGYFEVVDSNWNSDGMITRHWMHPESFARSKGRIAAFYRLSAGTPEQPDPLPDSPGSPISY